MCHWQHGNNIENVTLILVLHWRAADGFPLHVQIMHASCRMPDFAAVIALGIACTVAHASRADIKLFLCIALR
jgi:hypothetical protein